MKKKIEDHNGRRVHACVPELCEQLRKGGLDRREFLRTVTLLGVSAAAAYGMAGKILGGPAVKPARAAETPKRGGSLRWAMEVQEADDPARFDWTPKSNVTRHLVEYLCHTGPDNITRPYLAEGWEASDDLKTWTFKLRRGVKWSNGDDFGADDVIFNFKRWLNPKTGSSNIGLFSAMTEETKTGKKDDQGNPVMATRMTEGAAEKIDAHTVRLNLNTPVLSMPENLYNYPAAIVHRRFEEEGGDLSKNPVGTGAFALAEYRLRDKAVLRRRDGYWGPRPFLDEIVYSDLGGDQAAWLAALAAGQVDGIYEFSVNQLEMAEKLSGVEVHTATTAQTGVARMQVDKAPFTDKRVRQALQACMDHRELLKLAYGGKGAPGEDHHVSPIHPEYARLEPQKPDHGKAKRLLFEAGYRNGIKITIELGNTTGDWEQDAMRAFKEQCRPAGIDLTVKVVSSARYAEIWNKTPFGFTSWTHRPLGVMVLNLAYRTGVPWNESHYSNPAFDLALDEASATLDVNERRKKMARVQAMLQDDAVILQPLWRAVFSATGAKVRGYRLHPTLYHQFNEVWLS